MSNISSFTAHKHRPKVLFFGMQGNFSAPSLLALLKQGIEVCAVVLPASPVSGREAPHVQRREQLKGRGISLPLLTMPINQSIIEIAWREQIPVWDVYHLSHKETYDVLASYQPDMICVVCFSQRIPRSILDLPRSGCLNVHPSLLPANRGPEPLFWTFREGHETTGVTIHVMSEEMDSGDILAQEAVAVPDGISYEQLESQLAHIGGTLLAKTVWDVYRGNATYTSQDETKSYYHSFPSNEDFVVQADEWDARHAYNFIQGVGHWNGAVTLVDGEKTYLVRDAFSYSLDSIKSDLHRDKNEQGLVVFCKKGFIMVKSL